MFLWFVFVCVCVCVCVCACVRAYLCTREFVCSEGRRGAWMGGMSVSVVFVVVVVCVCVCVMSLIHI